MKKLKVGIVGANKISRLIVSKFIEKENRFEVFKNNTWQQDFDDIGVLDVLWMCKEFKSNKRLKKETIRLIAEYNPALCLISVPVKPFTILKLQKIIKTLGLKTSLVYVISSCPDAIIDWQRYAPVFRLLVGWDLSGALLLTKTLFTDLTLPIRTIEGSFNLEISKLLLNSNYLLYNYIEHQRKRIFRFYERKNKSIEREAFQDVQFETSEGLIEIQKQNLILPSVKSDLEKLQNGFLGHLSRTLKLRFLISTYVILERFKLRLQNKFELIKLKVKGRLNKLKRKNKHDKLSNSLRSKSKQKTL